ncbi:MAG: hypothetical protein DHS20C01_32700 [marine bacterium B5-7]|nr:MAG: hypothetical protein DHS20C01_32700 [marine bacterium B5-7]
MKGGRIVGASILTVIALVFVAWLSLPYVIGRIATSALADYGFDDVAVNVADIGVTGMTIKRLELTEANSGLSIDIDTARVGYQLNELLDRRVRSLDIGSLTIDITSQNDQSDDNSLPLVVPDTLPVIDSSSWIDWLPVEGMNIDRLTVLPPGEARVPIMTAHVVTKADAVWFGIQTVDGSGDDMTRVVEAVVDRSGRVALVIKSSEQPAPVLEINLDTHAPDGGHWSAEAKTSLEHLAEWLAPWVDLPPKGACGVHARLRLTENPLEAAIVNATMSDCSISGINFADARLNAHMMRTAHGMATITPLRLVLDKPGSDTFVSDHITVETGFDWTAKSNMIRLPKGARMTTGVSTLEGYSLDPLVLTLVETWPFNWQHPHGSVRLAADTFSLSSNDLNVSSTGLEASVAFNDPDGFGMPETSIKFIDATVRDGEIDIRLDGGSLVVKPAAGVKPDTNDIDILLTSNTASLLMPDTRVSVTDMAANAHIGHSDEIETNLTVATAQINSGEYEVELKDSKLAANLGRTTTAGTYTTALAGIVPLTGQFSVSTDGMIALNVSAAPFELGTAPQRASQLLRKGWPEGMELVNGRLSFSSDVKVDNDGVRVNASIMLDEVGGVVEGVYFSDASTELDLEVYPQLVSMRPAKVTVAVVDFGVSLKNLDGEYHIEGIEYGAPVVVVKDLSGELFDGHIRIPSIDTRSQQSIDVIVESLDLKRMVGEDQFSGLEVSGRVSGEIPVTLTEEGPTVRDGLVKNVEDGVINYDPGSDGAGSGAEILFRALKEFEYTVLSVEPRYQADGTLLLKIHMEGTSEEIGRSQPIHFNVNLEQNLLALLKSVRVVSGLNDTIDKKVQEFYKTNTPQS